jgi:hypothetical protein
MHQPHTLSLAQPARKSDEQEDFVLKKPNEQVAAREKPFNMIRLFIYDRFLFVS